MRKKEILAKLLYYSGATRIAAALPKKDNTLIILAYHRILPDNPNFEFDKELISATPEDFEWQIQHLKKHYNLSSFRELSEIIDSKKILPSRSIIITFDDGFDDNFQHAYPLLKKHNAPATFFISTDYIGSDKVFWFDWAVYLCKKLRQDATLTAQNFNQIITLSTTQTAENRAKQLLSFLKIIPDTDRHIVIKQLEDIVKPDATQFTESHAMNWEEIHEMQQSSIIEFGSHTCSHPILAQLGAESIATELQISKQMIEAKLQVPCTTLAYPVGGANAVNNDVLKAVAESGYRYACTYQPGLNTPPLNQPFELRRLHIERYTTKPWFASMLTFPKFFAM
jgi:peptidoglycan/xylan/chitin deacetylase (PgdA/CDA1 family)